MEKIIPIANIGKFADPFRTATGEPRAKVGLKDPKKLWFNVTSTCNLTCKNCSVDGAPDNDELSFIGVSDVQNYLNQIKERKWGVTEIGFTGGESFLNPNSIDLIRLALESGYTVLVLTNAMKPMMRPRVQSGLKNLHALFGNKLTLRISLDHYTAKYHDIERGDGSFNIALKGMRWLRDIGISMRVAGRSIVQEDELTARIGYNKLYMHNKLNIDAYDEVQTLILPEMDQEVDVPEITTSCWDTLGKSPKNLMCSDSRVVVKRKGSKQTVVVACTLLPYDKRFELGSTLEEAEQPVMLNHPYCSQFCVLGGGSCS